MAELFAYMDGFGAGGSLTKSILIVAAPTGSTVTVTKGSTAKTAMEKNGEWWFKNLENGEWTIRAELDGQSATDVFNITQFGVYRKPISYRMTPEFTYTGDYEIVQDDDTPIEDFASWKGNWKIRFLTSGDFTITKMHGDWDGCIDVFLCGAGGGGEFGPYKSTNWIPGPGGGSGHTKTQKKVSLSLNTVYSIIIGSGGQKGMVSGSKHPTAGGDTKAFENTAEGGKPGNSNGTGGNGGSGGGALYANGGSDGGNGADHVFGDNGQYRTKGGTGQGTTTKEFTEEAGKLYAYGGPGGYGTRPGYNNNTIGNGGSGGGQQSDGGPGFSGIVIIRNAREVAQ